MIWRRSGIFIVNFKHISHLSIANFEQVNAGWDTNIVNISQSQYNGQGSLAS